MNFKSCQGCNRDFIPKFDGAVLCFECFLKTARGQQWQQRKANESNGFRDTFKQDWDDLSKARERQAQEDAQARERTRDRARADRQRFDQRYGGGQRHNPFGSYGAPPSEGVTIDKDLLRRLIMLCHPDKHGGSEMSTNVTKILLEMKGKL